ncbi:TENA/THI-4/PQQC family protein [Roseivivax jejudonensis]|uniref:Aminopyrimidine aminohydrolase n=1 Tax=Roseivivax jejudonensis TaxID=1529041 RepID=A0A1X6Y5H3_9RHOB|nr:TenA family protein [Roseivivax jejudonensis]SLN11042.1 TENA/THI-4/PQQC family protein [Roseivivax jejudonensis]
MVENLSDRCLRENRDAFDRMVGHRFVRDIATDALPRAVFDRYLLIEGEFVATAISIFAFATIKTEDIGDRRRLIAVQHALANDQIPYFEKLRDRRAIAAAPQVAKDPRVVAFDRGMFDIAAKGDLPQILAAMFAAEWMYLTWCQRVSSNPISDPDIRKWVDMHTDADFSDQAHWLKTRLDAAGAKMDEAQAAACSRIFGTVQDLEYDFHEAAY